MFSFVLFSDAESLGAHLQGYASEANGTVPDCHGDESRLSDCPALPTPDNCDINCARVNCMVILPEKTLIVQSSFPTATDYSTSQTSVTLVTRKAPSPTLTTPPSSPDHLHIPTSAKVEISTRDEPSKSVVSKSVASKSIASKSVASKSVASKTVTTQEDKSSNAIFSLNKVTVAVIGGVVMTIVTAGIVACTCFIVCGVRRGQKYRVKKKNSALKITTQLNPSYASHTEIVTRSNPAYERKPSEPIYENME